MFCSGEGTLFSLYYFLFGVFSDALKNFDCALFLSVQTLAARFFVVSFFKKKEERNQFITHLVLWGCNLFYLKKFHTLYNQFIHDTKHMNNL